MSAGDRSPPLASIAMGSMGTETRRASVDFDGLAAVVPPAVGADDVGDLHHAAARAEAARRAAETPVRGATAAALRLGGLLLGDGHGCSTSDAVPGGRSNASGPVGCRPGGREGDTLAVSPRRTSTRTAPPSAGPAAPPRPRPRRLPRPRWWSGSAPDPGPGSPRRTADRK